MRRYFRFSCILFGCLFLFSCSARDTPAPVVGIYGAIPLKDRVKNTITGSVYTVKKGETLFSIAWRANSDVRHIAQLNKISSPYKIFPGQKIFLTKKQSQKTSNASKNKHSTKKPSKGSKSTTQKSDKKVLASSKKQAYGENVTDGKTYQKSTSTTKEFSQKVRRWQWPVKGKIIEYFSSKVQGNKGVNIAGRRGTNIKAAADGKVVYAGDALRGYGKLVIIKHNDDYLSAYAHNDKILVKEQQKIKGGSTIAKMGDTDSAKVMLHFEIRFRGKSVNPLNYLPKK
jgi:lipoprotein NlpD